MQFKQMFATAVCVLIVDSYIYMSFTCMFGINYVKPQLLTVSDSDFPEYSLSESHRIVVYRFQL